MWLIDKIALVLPCIHWERKRRHCVIIRYITISKGFNFRTFFELILIMASFIIGIESLLPQTGLPKTGVSPIEIWYTWDRPFWKICAINFIFVGKCDTHKRYWISELKVLLFFNHIYFSWARKKSQPETCESYVWAKGLRVHNETVKGIQKIYIYNTLKIRLPILPVAGQVLFQPLRLPISV